MHVNFSLVSLAYPKTDYYVTYFGGDEQLGLPPDEECRNIWINLG